MKTKYLFICLLAALTLPVNLQAHAPNQSYIFLRVYEDGIGGRFEITTDDLNRALKLDLKRGLTTQELTPLLPQIHAYYLEHVVFAAGDVNFPIRFDETSIMPIELGDFVQLHFTLEGADDVPEKLDIRYDILFDIDPSHQGLQVIEYRWRAGIINNEAMVSLIFGPDDPHQQLDLTDSSVMQGFIAMIRSGMHHIFIGLDHVLFLLALLLPGVVRRMKSPAVAATSSNLATLTFFPMFLRPYADVWSPVANFKSALVYLLKIVTFFTIAHTITLSLAALQVIKLPSALVESVIAL
ncbi:MAG: HupE/UreJ family protein, partial [Cyclobacteriaceae bacterium]